MIWRNLSNKKCSSQLALFFDYPTGDIEIDYNGCVTGGIWDKEYYSKQSDCFIVDCNKTKWIKTDGRICIYAYDSNTEKFHFADYETPAYPGKVEFFITDGADNSVHTLKSKIDGRTLKVSGINLWVVE